jgi:hypothetical protein
MVNAGAVAFLGKRQRAAFPAEVGTRALLAAAGPRIAGSAASPIAALIAALKGRPPTLEPDPIEWSVLDPGENLAPGSRHIATIEGVCAEPSDGGSGSAGLASCELRAANCEL